MGDLIPVAEVQTSPTPFTDPNFKLAVLSSLLDDKVLDFGDYPAFLKFIEGTEYDYEERGYEPSAKAQRYLTHYPLTTDQLAKVDTLVFDGGNTIYPYVYPFWGGETEEFDIRSLDDLRLLPNLETFEIISMLWWENPDLTALRHVPKLKTLGLGLTATWQNIEVLEQLPNLKELTVFGHDLDEGSALNVVKQLEQRGVRVQIF
ncbi:hypothetical protein [Actibacterium sp. 188UL27-1]|uniref:DUF6892 domain-containing protein n=1 Tax=Actibacterium sp. 188UL27-1 TaxID=2786961 RepID=UPI00195A59BD|nr:hypothetical protein [Actibacterium sp. 188UL27-1]MBM7068345.1 hypothetical protein [Actibacterium sp. 188UL27-1]